MTVTLVAIILILALILTTEGRDITTGISKVELTFALITCYAYKNIFTCRSNLF